MLMRKPGARWFCAVKSSNTFGSYDFGDVYVSEIKQNAVKVMDQVTQELMK